MSKFIRQDEQNDRTATKVMNFIMILVALGFAVMAGCAFYGITPADLVAILRHAAGG
jgi:hypothetical protein